jgi:hypothetical protein
MDSEIEYLKQTMGQFQNDPVALRKALTAATGFVGFNLEEQAKLMIPMFAGFRNRLAVDTPKQGALAATWRMMLGYGAFNFANNMGTANGANGGATTPASTTISASYHSQSIHGDVEWEAIQQARGFDDPRAIETSLALATLISYDELLCIFGNLTLLAPPVIAGVPSTLTTANTFAAGTWHVRVTAITGQGTVFGGAGRGGSVLNNVGETAISNSLAIVVPGGDCDFLDVSWAPVAGALGYKVYVERTAGGGAYYLCDPAVSLRYRKITAGATDLTAFGDAIVVPTGQTYVGVTHVQIIAVGDNAMPADPGAIDNSANANSFEGAVAWAEKNTIYGQALPQNHPVTNMNGAPLTTSGTGIAEIDAYLLSLWQTYRIAPNLCLTSASGVNSMTNKLVAANSGSMFRLDVTNERAGIKGGLYMTGYNNKFSGSMQGGPQSLEVWAHPDMPDGTFVFLAEELPAAYKYSRTGKTFALDVQTPYTYLGQAIQNRSFPFDVFFGETLKCYNPSVQGAIVGARVDA